MGVVYKARQRGLKRLVALKMILADRHAGEEERARFRAEAEAIAELRHPNIVQVYEVGEDGGRPYFSLEYIDGDSLARKIDGTPQPPRQAAELTLLLARAMEFAHRQGVIHRDLKPANVLLAPDGLPKVTDFGLAKRLDDDTGRTRSGAVLGTPSYMPPEQAEGKIEQVGPLSDVYSLGAILYELLTGRPPFRGTGILDTLQMVRTREPVPPSGLQPKIPRDLETICLKCLQKEPRKRYASAEALAEDLRRFLGGEPIRARPVSAAERLWRWCRRNQRVAALTAVVALLLVAWAATSSALAYLAWRSEQRANANADLARKNEEAAKQNAEAAKKHAAAALANEQRAKKNEETAKTLHQQTVSRMVVLAKQLQQKLRDRRLAQQMGPTARTVREELLGVVRQRLLEMGRAIEKAEVTSFGMAATHQQLGDLFKGLGQGEEALRQYRQGARLVQMVVDEKPASDVARANLGVMLMRLGDVALDLNGDAEAARAYYRKGWDLQHEIFKRPRSGEYTEAKNHILLSHYAVRLGRASLALGDPGEADKQFRVALGYRQAWLKPAGNSAEARSYLTEAHMWLGVAGWHRGDGKAVQQHFGEAVRLCEELVKQHPKYAGFRSDLAEVYGAQGDAQLRLGRADEAAASYRKSLESLQAALARNPEAPALQPPLALAEERLAGDALRRGQREEAERRFREALKVREELAGLEPDNLVARAAHVLALAHCGKYTEAARGAEDLRRRAPRCAELLLQAARAYAACAAGAEAQRPLYTQKALEILQAVAALPGYRDVVALRTDPDLAPLRDEPGFQALQSKLDRK
jgi:serine/threonine-protein kinase